MSIFILRSYAYLISVDCSYSIVNAAKGGDLCLMAND